MWAERHAEGLGPYPEVRQKAQLSACSRSGIWLLCGRRVVRGEASGSEAGPMQGSGSVEREGGLEAV